jgi:hypothetical protein
MRIKFYLLDNFVTSDPNDRRAQVSGYEIVTEKELFEYVTRAGSGITPAEARANYEEIIGAFAYFPGQGYGVNTEFVNIRPVISGVFRSDDDKFDPARHKIKFKASPGKRYSHTADSVKVEKIVAPGNLPLPVTFDDLVSETVNETLTPGW